MPTKKPTRDTLAMVNFRADAELLRAIDELAAAVGLGVTGAKSTAIRRAILEAHARLTSSARAPAMKRRTRRTPAPRYARPGSREWAERVAPVDGMDALKATIARHVGELDEQHGGLVPLPVLRGVLAARYTATLRDDQDRALLELEREHLVELKIAQSPATLADRSSGIAAPGRGLIFYVSTRRA